MDDNLDVNEVIQNAQKVVAVFGKWPSFHDAEVCSLRLDRKGVSMEADIYVFSTASSVDKGGYYTRLNESVITLRFVQIEDLEMDGFNHQNVIASLTVQGQGRLSIMFEPIFGLGCRLTCSAVEVVSVVPYRRSLTA